MVRLCWALGLLYGRSYIFSFFVSFRKISGQLPLDRSRPRYIQQRDQAHARHGAVRSRRHLQEAVHRGTCLSFVSRLRALLSKLLTLTPPMKIDVRRPSTRHPRRRRRTRSRPQSKAEANDDQIRYAALSIYILYLHVHTSCSRKRLSNRRRKRENTSVCFGYFVSTHSDADIHPPNTSSVGPCAHEGPCTRHAVDCVCAMSAQHCMRTCRCASNCTSFLISFLIPSC